MAITLTQKENMRDEYDFSQSAPNPYTETASTIAKAKINRLLKITLPKNATIEATDEWWEQQRQQLIHKHLPPS
jgi:TusA-related sulfurtransferase